MAKQVGLSPQAISAFESNDRNPKMSNWIKLADYFGVSVSYIQGLTNSNSAESVEILDTLDIRTCEDLIEGIYNKSKHNDPSATFCYQSICLFLLKYKSIF